MRIWNTRTVIFNICSEHSPNIAKIPKTVTIATIAKESVICSTVNFSIYNEHMNIANIVNIANKALGVTLV